MGYQTILGLLEMLDANPNIVYLDLTSCDIGHEGAIEIFEWLAENKTLVYLNLLSLAGLNRNRLLPGGVEPLEWVLGVNKTL